MKQTIILLLVVIFSGCHFGDKKVEKEIKRSHPSHIYNFVEIDTSLLKYFETDYLPVYSDIYYQDGTRRFPITATVSIRNTSLADSAFILSATYQHLFCLPHIMIRTENCYIPISIQHYCCRHSNRLNLWLKKRKMKVVQAQISLSNGLQQNMPISY